jgi:hypothetical protein
MQSSKEFKEKYHEKFCKTEYLYDSIASDIVWLDAFANDYSTIQREPCIHALFHCFPVDNAANPRENYDGAKNIEGCLRLSKQLLILQNYRENIRRIHCRKIASSGMVHLFLFHLSDNDMEVYFMKSLILVFGSFEKVCSNLFFLLLSSLSKAFRISYKKALNEPLKFCDYELYYAVQFRLGLEEKSKLSRQVWMNSTTISQFDLTSEFVLAQLISSHSLDFYSSSTSKNFEKWFKLNFSLQNMCEDTAQTWNVALIQYLVNEEISLLRLYLSYEELVFTRFILRHLGLRLQRFQFRSDIKISLLSMISSLLEASSCTEEFNYSLSVSCVKNSNSWHYKLLELLLCLGSHILAADMVLYIYVLRYFRLATQNLELNTEIDLLIKAFGFCFCPSLSYFPNNPAVADEIWSALNNMPHQARYRVYNLWVISNNPNVHFLEQLKTQRALRRLSKENAKDSGKKIGKIAHSNPITTLSVIVNQVQAYPNMVVPAVDSLKYMSYLSFDILVYLILTAFFGKNEKMKEDGLNACSWFAALSKFCGYASFKYVVLDIQALLHYVLNAIRDYQTAELLILKEILLAMAGNQLLENLSKEQVESLAGGKELQNQVSNACNVFSNSKVKSIQRLRHAFEKHGSDSLVNPYLVLLARNLQCLIFCSKFEKLHLLVRALDYSREIFAQFVNFLQVAYTESEYKACIPSVLKLKESYYLSPDVVFKIHRKHFQISEFVETFNLEMNTSNLFSASQEKSNWHSLNIKLCELFWNLSLHHIHIPERCYSDIISKLTSQNMDSSSSSFNLGSKHIFTSEKIGECISRLKLEMFNQKKDSCDTRIALRSLRNIFPSDVLQRTESICNLMQNLVLPRCSNSISDAMFTANFFESLRQTVPHFDFFQYFDIVMEDIEKKIECCTDFEAEHYGYFLDESFRKIIHISSNDDYVHLVQESYNTSSTQRKGEMIYSQIKVKKIIIWHRKLLHAFMNLLRKGSQYDIRKSLVILNKISTFPALLNHGEVILREVKNICSSCDYNDIKTITRSYDANLKQRKIFWKTEDEFITSSISSVWL